MNSSAVVSFLPDFLQPYVTPDRLAALATHGATAIVTLVLGWLIAGWAGRLARAALLRSCRPS